MPAGSARKKNSHASAWHIDHAADVRSLMSVEPDEQWFATAHHELGHIYYYISYSTPAVPMLLREGANRAFHEAVGELAKLASQQTPYLVKVGVMPRGKEPDAMAWLLQSAMESIVFMPFSAGTMSHFERDLYEANLPPSEWQKKWWDYAGQYQGVEPPVVALRRRALRRLHQDPHQRRRRPVLRLRAGEPDQVPAARSHLHEDPQQDVRACDYSGNHEVGDFLRGILKLGATRDWRAVIQEATGEPISPRAMMAFYQPLVDELSKRNAGKDCSR